MGKAETKTQEAAESSEADKKRRDRSPSFPFINLETAVERAKAFHKAEGKNETTPEVAAKHWGYAAKSSGALQTLAALKSFGLLGTSNTKVRLTDRALRIILDGRPDSVDREAHIRDAALAPRIHKELWEKYGKNLPSDATLKTELVLERGFQESGADRFISEYKDTIALAKLGESDNVEPILADPFKKGPFGGSPMQPSIGTSKPSSEAPLEISLPLPRGNHIMIRLGSKLSPDEFKALSDLLKFSIVGSSEKEAN